MKSKSLFIIDLWSLSLRWFNHSPFSSCSHYSLFSPSQFQSPCCSSWCWWKLQWYLPLPSQLIFDLSSERRASGNLYWDDGDSVVEDISKNPHTETSFSYVYAQDQGKGNLTLSVGFGQVCIIIFQWFFIILSQAPSQPKLEYLEIFDFPTTPTYTSFTIDGKALSINTQVRYKYQQKTFFFISEVELLEDHEDSHCLLRFSHWFLHSWYSILIITVTLLSLQECKPSHGLLLYLRCSRQIVSMSNLLLCTFLYKILPFHVHFFAFQDIKFISFKDTLQMGMNRMISFQ